jgi:hypothetical protein
MRLEVSAHSCPKCFHNHLLGYVITIKIPNYIDDNGTCANRLDVTRCSKRKQNVVKFHFWPWTYMVLNHSSIATKNKFFPAFRPGVIGSDWICQGNQRPTDTSVEADGFYSDGMGLWQLRYRSTIYISFSCTAATLIKYLVIYMKA